MRPGLRPTILVFSRHIEIMSTRLSFIEVLTHSFHRVVSFLQFVGQMYFPSSLYNAFMDAGIELKMPTERIPRLGTMLNQWKREMSKHHRFRQEELGGFGSFGSFQTSLCYQDGLM
jgi:hypothetical protein